MLTDVKRETLELEVYSKGTPIVAYGVPFWIT